MGGDAASAAGDSTLIQLGAIGAPYGVRGWVKLRSFTDPPEGLLAHKQFQLVRKGGSDAGPGETVTVEASGRSGGQITAKLSGVADRDMAQALRGAAVCVPRAALPQRNDRDFYRADLIGCAVTNLAGAQLGTVSHFVETPAHAVMVVRGATEHWVPAVAQHLRRVDLAARQVLVDWDAAAD